MKIMKRIVLTTAIVLGLAAPAFAASQLERTVGADTGAYTLSQLVELKFAADEHGGGSRVVIADNSGISTKGVFTTGAATQLEKSLNVAAGSVSVSDLVDLHSAADLNGEGSRVYLGNSAPTAAQEAVIAGIFADIAKADRGDES